MDTTFRSFLSAQSARSINELAASLAATWISETGASGCDIMLADRDERLVMCACTLAPHLTGRVRLGRGVGICGQVFQTGKPLYVPRNVHQHPGYAQLTGLDETSWSGAAVLPLETDAERIGVVMLRSDGPWRILKKERERMQQLAEATALTLAGYNAAFEAGSQTSKLGALSEVTKTLSTVPYLEEILQLLVSLTAQQFSFAMCTVRLLDEQRGELVLRAAQSVGKAYVRKPAIRLGESIAGRAIAENRPVCVDDVQSDPEYVGHDLAEQQGLRSMICIPLTIQNRPVGVMSCYTTEVRAFTDNEIAALETLAKQAAISIEHAKLQVRHTLMQEMHHRVKNSLQQVASLLRLQLTHGQYKTLEQALHDTISRILAIASVHDLLTREDLDHVGVRSVAQMLVQHQQSSLILPNRTLRFEVRGEDVHLNMSQATQVALILNELIQNAVEHGFRLTTEGDIHVNVESADGSVSIWVSNNGDLLPKAFTLDQSHLGLHIVDSLSRALGGRFKIGEVLGWTVAEVKFHHMGAE